MIFIIGSGGTLTMAQSNNYKSPPVLTDVCYEKWKKESKIWRMFTSFKQAPAIFKTLTGQACEAVLELDPDTLPVDSGVENLIKALDNLYLKNRDYSAYEAYETFEKFKRPPFMTVNNYIIEFERLYHEIKNYDMDLPDGMLAYNFLNNGNILEHWATQS